MNKSTLLPINIQLFAEGKDVPTPKEQELLLQIDKLNEQVDALKLSLKNENETTSKKIADLEAINKKYYEQSILSIEDKKHEKEEDEEMSFEDFVLNETKNIKGGL